MDGFKRAQDTPCSRLLSVKGLFNAQKEVLLRPAPDRKRALCVVTQGLTAVLVPPTQRGRSWPARPLPERRRKHDLGTGPTSPPHALQATTARHRGPETDGHTAPAAEKGCVSPRGAPAGQQRRSAAPSAGHGSKVRTSHPAETLRTDSPPSPHE